MERAQFQRDREALNEVIPEKIKKELIDCVYEIARHPIRTGLRRVLW